MTRSVLPNGLVVLISETSTVPLFTAALALEAGSRYEPEDRSGLGAMMAGLLIDGSHASSGDEIARRVDSIGASLDVVTDHETSTLAVTGSAPHCGDALDLLAELVTSPRFEERALEEARERQLADITGEEDEPYSVCRRRFFEMVFAGHPKGRSVTGSAEAVRGLTREDVQKFHEERCRPGAAVLAVAGEVDGTRLLDTIREAFGGWVDSVVVEPTFPAPDVPDGVRRLDIHMAREQVHVSIGSVGITRCDPHYYATSVMDVILGDSAGFGSRLATRLRERDGLAYVVESDASSTAGRDPGVFWAYVATSPQHLDAAVCGILDEMRRIRREPPSADELTSAISYLQGRHRLARETNESRVARLIGVERFGLGLDYEDRYASIVGSVTGEDVLAAARRVVDPERYSIVIVGPSCLSPAS